MLNSDINNGGIYKAYVLNFNGDFRIYIPGLNNNRIFNMTDIENNNLTEFVKWQYTFPKATWCVPNLEAQICDNIHPCWVTFESGDEKRPIVMGWVGDGIKYSVSGGINTVVVTGSINPQTGGSPTGSYNDIPGSTIQEKVVNFAKTFKGYPNQNSSKGGYCQAWVADVYHAVLGGNRISSESAKTACAAWGEFTDIENIPLGACVYANYDPHGHVGIYIGDGLIANNRGSNKQGEHSDAPGIPQIDSIAFYYGWAKDKPGFTGLYWGWNGGSEYDLSKMS